MSRHGRGVILRALTWLPATLLTLWAIAALRFAPVPIHPAILAPTLLAAAAFLLFRLPRRARPLALLIPAAAVATLFLTLRPSHDRHWAPDHARLPTPEFDPADPDTVTIRNIRAFVYRSAADFDPIYRDDTFDLRTLRHADFIVVPFSPDSRLAHTMLSFGFADGRHIVVSIEARREAHERYSPLRGLFRNYELIYVIADESDALYLRTNIRNDTALVYPVAGSHARLRALFEDMLHHADAIARRPEFYHSLFNSCTSNLLDHANRVAAVRVPWTYEILLPALTDRLAHRTGVIINDRPLDELRAAANITPHARTAPSQPTYSAHIRGSDPSPQPDHPPR